MRDPFNFTWIEDGSILAGSMPTCRADIDVLYNLGVRHILSLTRRHPGDCDEIRNAIDSPTKILHTLAPIPDNGIPEKHLTVITALHAIRMAKEKNEAIYVHCRGGIGRTGLILIAWYVMDQGLSIEEARQKVSVRRNYQGNACACDQGSPQREWIYQLTARGS